MKRRRTVQAKTERKCRIRVKSDAAASFFAKRRIRFSAIFLRSLTCLSCVRNRSQNGVFSIGMDLPDSMGAHTQRIPQFTPMDGRNIDPFMGVKDWNPWEQMPKDSERSLPRSDSARPAFLSDDGRDSAGADSAGAATTTGETSTENR